MMKARDSKSRSRRSSVQSSTHEEDAHITTLRRHRPDHAIPMIAGLLLLFSLIIIYSVSPALTRAAGSDVSESYYMYRQFIHITLGVVAFCAAAFMPISFWRKIQPLLIAVSVASMILILIPGIGQEVNGATRWIDMGPITFQPSELLKFTMLLYLAAYVAQRIKDGRLDDRSETLIPVLAMVGVVGFFVVILQKDLGTMISLVAIVMGILYVGGLKIKDLAIFVGAMVGAAIMAVIIAPHRLERVFTFLNPNADISGTAYHINQALIAVGSGGVAGKGLGRSVQVYGYLPEAETDSIFAIIAEKFGFIGSLAVLFLFGALFIRLLRVVIKIQNAYLRLVSAGIFSWVVSHTIINIGAMLGLMPLTGITLPLLSLGGTSLLFIMAALGLVFNISRYTALGNANLKEPSHANSRSGRGIGRTRYSHPARSRRAESA